MAERCRHRRVLTSEGWVTALCSFQVDGEIVERSDTNYETTGMFEVACIDCPAKVRTSPWAKSAPRWARDAIRLHTATPTTEERDG